MIPQHGLLLSTKRTLLPGQLGCLSYYHLCKAVLHEQRWASGAVCWRLFGDRSYLSLTATFGLHITESTTIYNGLRLDEKWISEIISIRSSESNVSPKVVCYFLFLWL